MDLITTTFAPRTRESLVYDLSTVKGTFVAWLQATPIIPVVYYAFWNDKSLPALLAAGFSGFVLAFFTGPQWFYTITGMAEARAKAVRVMECTTPESFVTEQGIKYLVEAQRFAQSMAKLNPAQVDFAKRLTDLSELDINGVITTWTVNNVTMPVVFSLDWWANCKDDEHLPAIRSWVDSGPRDWAININNTLVSMGYAEPAAGNISAKWIGTDKKTRGAARVRGLNAIGFFAAKRAAESIGGNGPDVAVNGVFEAE